MICWRIVSTSQLIPYVIASNGALLSILIIIDFNIGDIDFLALSHPLSGFLGLSRAKFYSNRDGRRP